MHQQQVKPTMSFEETSHQIADVILNTNSILFDFEKGFQYTSGNRGPVYVDIRRLISFPLARTQIMNQAALYIKSENLDIDTVAGGETAGIPFAAMIADRLEKPMIYVRKKPKGVGRMAQIEGCLDNTKKTIIVEDLCNFGASATNFVNALRSSHLDCNDAFVIFDYGRDHVKQDFKSLGVKLHSLCGWDDVFFVAQETGRLSLSEIETVKKSLL